MDNQDEKIAFQQAMDILRQLSFNETVQGDPFWVIAGVVDGEVNQLWTAPGNQTLVPLFLSRDNAARAASVGFACCRWANGEHALSGQRLSVKQALARRREPPHTHQSALGGIPIPERRPTAIPQGLYHACYMPARCGVRAADLHQ